MHNIAVKENDENEFFADINDVSVDNDVSADISYEINDFRNRNRNEVIDRRMKMFRELFSE